MKCPVSPCAGARYISVIPRSKTKAGNQNSLGIGAVGHDESALHGLLASSVNRRDPCRNLLSIGLINLPVGTKDVDFDVLQLRARRPGHDRRSIGIRAHVCLFEIFSDDRIGVFRVDGDAEL